MGREQAREPASFRPEAGQDGGRLGQQDRQQQGGGPGVTDAIPRQVVPGKFGKLGPQEPQGPARGGEPDFVARFAKRADQGNATAGMPQTPIEGTYEDSHADGSADRSVDGLGNGRG